MKIDKKIFDHIREAYTNRHNPEGRHDFANLYWRMLLLVTGVLIGLCIFYAAGLLIDVLYNLDVDTIQAQKAAQPLLNRTQLQNTIDTFEARQKNFDAFKAASFTPIGDPS